MIDITIKTRSIYVNEKYVTEARTKDAAYSQACDMQKAYKLAGVESSIKFWRKIEELS